MVEVEGGVAAGSGPQTAGEMLREAREAQGMTLDDVCTRTRIPVKHLSAVEDGRYGDLPSSIYAVGFSRAFARAVGLSDAAVAQKVRAEVERLGPRKPEYEPYEMADPARVPSRGLAVVGLGVALGLLILAALWFGATRFAASRGDEPAAATDKVVAAAPTPAATSPTPAAPTGGQVTLTATDEVWLRVYDAADKTLFIGNMKAGDRFDVPADANDPKINVGRPDKLQVTLNGSAAPPLGDGSRPIKDVPVSDEAIARRIQGAATTPAPAA